MAPWHYLDRCCLFVNTILGNEVLWNYESMIIFIRNNAIEDVCKIEAILCQPQCVFFLSYSVNMGSWSYSKKWQEPLIMWCSVFFFLSHSDLCVNMNSTAQWKLFISNYNTIFLSFEWFDAPQLTLVWRTWAVTLHQLTLFTLVDGMLVTVASWLLTLFLINT